MSPTSWYALLLLLGVINVLLCVRLGRLKGTHESSEPGVAGIRLIVVLGWAYAVIPGFTQLLTKGRRQIITVDQTEVISPQTGVAIFVLSILLILTSLVVAGHAVLLRKPDVATPATALALLMPWAAMTGIALIESQPVTAAVAAYPLILIAFWRVAPPLSVATLLGHLVMLTAAVSLTMGAFGSLATVSNAEFISKSLVSTTSVLAGPFTHPNQLGSFLSLGLPSVLLIRNRAVRIAGISCIMAAVLWSASRTSIATVVVVLVLYALGRRRVFKPRTRKIIAGGALCSALTLMVMLPIAIGSSSAFNERGQVWIASIARWQDHALIGSGPLAYRAPGAYAAYLGPYAYHGHNMVINTLALGGIVGIVCAIPFVVVLFRRAVNGFAEGNTFPALFALAFLIDGILEVSTDFWKPSPTAIVVWFSAAFVAFSVRSHPPSARPSDTYEAPHQYAATLHAQFAATSHIPPRRTR